MPKSRRPTRSKTCASVLVEHDPESYDLMYNELANPLLWFVQHGLYDLPYSPNLGEETREAWEEGYVPVNRNFADAVVETAAGDDSPTILLHDYQLYMTPLFVRERLGDGRLHLPVRSHPLARARPLARPARLRQGWRAGEPTVGRHRGLPHPSLRPRLYRDRRRHPRRRGRERRGQVQRTRGVGAGVPHLHRPQGVRGARAERGCAGAGGVRQGSSWQATPARRSHGPLQEHRPRLRGLRPDARAPPRDEGRGHVPRPAPALPHRHPRVRRLHGGGGEDGRGGQREARQRTRGGP